MQKATKVKKKKETQSEKKCVCIDENRDSLSLCHALTV